MKLLTCIPGVVLLSMVFAARGIAAQAPAAPIAAPSPGSAASAVVKELIKVLDKNPAWELRLWVADRLGKLGPEAKEAVGALIPLLTDCVPAIQQSAADALGRIGPAAKEAAPALAARLTDGTPNVRNAAATALIEIGPDAQATVPVLTALLDDPCSAWDVRRNAADVLAAIGTRAHEEALRALKNRPESDSEPAAAWLLKNDPVARALENRLQYDSEPAVRIAAATALTSGLQGEYMAVPVPYVANLVHDPQAGVRALAAELLGRIDFAAEQVLKRDPPAEKVVKDAAEKALQESKQALKEMLHDPEYRVRIAAVRALGQLGLDAGDAYTDIAALLQDCIADVRVEAVAAMVQIKGG